MAETIKAEAKTTNEKVETLKHHPENPRVGNVPAIVESIRQNGWFGALIGQKSTRYILAGNHRLKAARELDIKTVPVIWLDIDDQAARKIVLTDNRTSDLATYDDEALASLLKELVTDAENVEALDGTGWTEWDMKRLLESVAADAPGDWQDYDESIDEEVPDVEEDGLKAVVCPECGHRIELK